MEHGSKLEYSYKIRSKKTLETTNYFDLGAMFPDCQLKENWQDTKLTYHGLFDFSLRYSINPAKSLIWEPGMCGLFISTGKGGMLGKTEFGLKHSGVCVCALATTLCDCIFVRAQNRYSAGFLYPYARNMR